MCNLNAPFFNDEESARTYLEGQRWPNGPICPHCGCDEHIYPIKADTKKSIRKGLYQCNDCEGQFTVTVGTVFERSKIPLHKWLATAYLLCSSKKGISAKQIERSLGITYKTAWFMCHRIREAMRDGSPSLMGGGGKTIEADETFVGGKPRHRSPAFTKAGRRRGRGTAKTPVVALVERGGGVRAQAVPSVTANTLRDALRGADKNSKLMTDELILYRNPGKEFSSHETVMHSAQEYVRGDVHTNTVEGFFSILKRGINGVYQHCSKAHLSRYVDEYSFRYNYREKLGYDDMARTNEALKGIEGKRITYQRHNPQ